MNSNTFKWEVEKAINLILTPDNKVDRIEVTLGIKNPKPKKRKRRTCISK